MTDAPLTYIDGGCDIGQSERCGKEARYCIATTAIADNAWAEDVRVGGVIRLCVEHAATPVSGWPALDASRRCSCGAPETTSLNPAEVVVHRADGPCYIAEAAR